MNPSTMKRGKLTFLALDGTSQQCVSAAADRTALTFSVIGGNATISDENPATATNGLQILATQNPWTICSCHAGDFVKKPLYVIGGAGATHLVIVEGFSPEAESGYMYG